MAKKLTTIGFDADDTLWHNERFFALTQDRFAELLMDHSDKNHLMARLLDAERRNLPHYGFGIKGFTLSMIETALDVTDGRVPGKVISEILAAGQEMLSHPIELFPHVESTLSKLRESHTLVLITKGDLLDQERKLAQSGLRDQFDAIEIVSHKTEHAYRHIFDRHGTGAKRGVMIGNSLASDVIPMIQADGWGVFVPFDLMWELEHAEAPKSHPRFRQIDNLSHITDLISEIETEV